MIRPIGCSPSGSTTYGYDANGNLQTRTNGTGTTTYGFDLEDQLNQVSGPGGAVSYGYDAEGRRVQRVGPAGTTNYLVDPIHPTGVSQVLAEHNGAGASLAENIWGNQLISQDRNGGPRFYHRDASNNIRLLTDSTGTVTDTYDYQAFGALHSSAGGTPNPYLFAGEQFDPVSGLYFLEGSLL